MTGLSQNKKLIMELYMTARGINGVLSCAKQDIIIFFVTSNTVVKLKWERTESV